MGYTKFVDSIIEKKLMDLHCAYIGRVISTDGETATVQPLGLIKATDESAKAQAVVSSVPVACRYKLTTKTINYAVDGDGNKQDQVIAVPEPLAKGDLVVCLCADRYIGEARKGKNTQPPAGRHSISDSIIVGIL